MPGSRWRCRVRRFLRFGAVKPRLPSKTTSPPKKKGIQRSSLPLRATKKITQEETLNTFRGSRSSGSLLQCTLKRLQWFAVLPGVAAGSAEPLVRGQPAFDRMAARWLHADVMVTKFSDVDLLHKFQFLLSARERQILQQKTQPLWQQAPQAELSAPQSRKRRSSTQPSSAKPGSKAAKAACKKKKYDEDMSATYALFD